MTSYYDFAREVLMGENLDQKVSQVSVDWTEWKAFELPKIPGRNNQLSFSFNRVKFPKPIHLNQTDKKAIALHSFANHELLAIEMMAAALLIYPHQTEEDIRFKKGILTAMRDEQKHLLLYVKRLNELGYAFGDFPLNDFFWRQMEKLTNPAQYTAVMAVTFEAANLDFAQYYSKIFRGLGDDITADIMDLVLVDEVSHVAFGAHWLKRWKNDKTLWNYYLETLPFPLTPARSKGIGYDPKIHQQAMNDSEFMIELDAYEDSFNVTNRFKT